MEKKQRVLYIICVSLLLCSLLLGCSRYTAPSPLDGVWQVVEVENHTSHPYPVAEDRVAYWDFLNVLYRVGETAEKVGGLRQKSWGNVYFNRDEIHFVVDESSTPFFPVPMGEGLKELSLKYKVWGGRLELKGEGYTIILQKQ